MEIKEKRYIILTIPGRFNKKKINYRIIYDPNKNVIGIKIITKVALSKEEVKSILNQEIYNKKIIDAYNNGNSSEVTDLIFRTPAFIDSFLAFKTYR